MKDRLEEFVSSHREEFDDLEPREGSWEKIEKEIAKDDVAKRDFTIWWKVAAMVLLCLTVGLVVERSFYSSKSQHNVAVVDTNFMKEMNDAEGHYSQLIHEKKSQIRFIVASKNLEDVELLQDMSQLDEMYIQLKSELASNQNDDRLISAMIQNLQLRVEILNRQLNILERISKKERDERVII